MTQVSVSSDCEDCDMYFKSGEESYHLRQQCDWWAVDKIDDRNHRHNGLARFSGFELAEKYLIWRWSSVTRSAIGAKSLGASLHNLGMAPGVEAIPTDREGAVELRGPSGSAVVPRSIVTIFSQLTSKSLDEIELLVHEGLH
jgi:hypothetical protein